jgi:hypothetical protein
MFGSKVLKKNWLDSEIAWLVDNYEEKGLQEAIRVLGRDQWSILHKVSRLKLRRRGEGRKPRIHVYEGYEVVSIAGERFFTHRRVVEKRLGRSLRSDEIVHHIDGNKLNNSDENLLVTSRAKHQKDEHKQSLEARRDAVTGQFKSNKVEEIV